MADYGVDVLGLSVGADLPYFTGYEAMPLERLTMLVVPRDADATLVVPKLEAPRVVEHPEVFSILPWSETENPVEIVAKLAGSANNIAIGNQTWAMFLVQLIRQMPGTRFSEAGEITTALRSIKDPAEIEALRAAGAAVDRIATELQAGRIPLVGRTEADVSADLSRRIIAEGHDRVNFAIVASGPNAASPHHHAGPRVIQPDEVVLCDFGGTMFPEPGSPGYCSDITRCVYTGEIPAEFCELYDVLFEAQASSVAAATVGTSCQDVDRAGRQVIADAGYGDFFIHRTGHGIGVEEHEDPYIVEGNETALVPGHAFSVEPGIYVPDRWGARLEDILVAAAPGPDAMNTVDHHLHTVEA